MTPLPTPEPASPPASATVVQAEQRWAVAAPHLATHSSWAWSQHHHYLEKPTRGFGAATISLHTFSVSHSGSTFQPQGSPGLQICLWTLTSSCLALLA